MAMMVTVAIKRREERKTYFCFSFVTRERERERVATESGYEEREREGDVFECHLPPVAQKDVKRETGLQD